MKNILDTIPILIQTAKKSLFFIYIRSLQTPTQYLQQKMWIIYHSVSSSEIRTDDFLNPNLFPKPLDFALKYNKEQVCYINQ